MACHSINYKNAFFINLLSNHPKSRNWEITYSRQPAVSHRQSSLAIRYSLFPFLLSVNILYYE